MSHFACRQFNFPSFHLLWSDDGRSIPLLYHPSGTGHPFLPLSWFSWAAIRTLFALSISARREAQWSKPRRARGEERRRGERMSGGTEKKGGGGRTKGKGWGMLFGSALPYVLRGGFQSSRGWREGKAGAGMCKIKKSKGGKKRDTKEDGVQWWAEWSRLCRMRCWWEKDPVSVFTHQFYQVSVKSRSCFPKQQNSDSEGRARTHVCVCFFLWVSTDGSCSARRSPCWLLTTRGQGRSRAIINFNNKSKRA